MNRELHVPKDILPELATLNAEDEFQDEPLDEFLVEYIPLSEQNKPDELVENSIGLYLRDIGNHPQIDRDMKIEYGYRIRKAADAIKKLNDIDIVSGDDQRTALEHAVKQGKEATEIMINSNLRLVVHYAKIYVSSGVPFLDLIQDGNTGLITAVDKFNPDKGEFSSYARDWIIKSIVRGIHDRGYVVRMPVNRHELIATIDKEAREFEKQHGRDPTLEELADLTGVDLAKLTRALEDKRRFIDMLSLHQPVSHVDGSAMLGDFVPDKRNEISDDAMLQAAIRQDIDKIYKRKNINGKKIFKPRSIQIVESRIGSSGHDPITLKALGELFGVTHERVRQIEAKTLQNLEKYGFVLRDYMKELE